jgi:hypothetical protein
VDVLASGSDRPPRLAGSLRRLPARVVAPGLALVVLGGVLGVVQVQRAERRADDVSRVGLRLVVERTTRAGDGSAYGFGRLEVVDAGGRPVALQGLDVDVPGLRLGRRDTSIGELDPAPTVVLPLRFAVPDCAELVLPGRLTAQVARPGRTSGTVSADLGPTGDDAGRAAAADLRRACGLPAG